MELRGENLLPWPIYKPYFFLDQANISGTSYKVYCLLCYPSKKVLSTSRCSASNLLRHMRKLHPTEVPKLKITGPGYKKSVPVKRKLNHENDQNAQEISIEIQDVTGAVGNTVTIIPEVATEKREVTMYDNSMSMSSGYHEEYVTQHKVDQLIIDYIVNGLHPPSLVERPEFQNLITGLQPERTIMSKVCVENIIADNANNFKRQLRDILAEIPHVATTADAWRVFNRCYVGVTVHWLDPETLDRRSAVLACRTTVGAHTYNEVTRVLDEVHEEFGIQNKVVQITTDNGFNFARTNRVFRFESKEDIEEVEITENDFEFVELTPILDSEGEETNLYNIPPHERCVVNTMYLLATLDTRKAEEEPLYKKALKDTLSRAQLLWKMQTSSLKNAEFVKEKLSQMLVEPKNNLWSSQYEALKHLQQVLKEKQESLHEVCDALEVPRFRDVDKVFVEEYCRVMKPVAAAIDALKSEKNAFLGILLPVLHALSRRLIYFRDQATNQDLLVICYPLLEAVIEGIDKRFSSHMLRRDLVLAAAFHPEFQLTWLKDPEKEGIATECLKEAVRDISLEMENSPAPPSEEDDELFDFKKPTAARNNCQQWENEVEQYLTYSTGQIKCLHSYPLIKDLFIQYNTALPSSAATEKTYCVFGDFFTHKNGFLQDFCCEDMLLVKTGIR